MFASGDLPRVAETLANMRHCLSAVGEVCLLPLVYFISFRQLVGIFHLKFTFFLVQVAEFANVRKQLEVLEDRLEEMVQPHLSDALSNRKVESTRLFLIFIPSFCMAAMKMVSCYLIAVL